MRKKIKLYFRLELELDWVYLRFSLIRAGTQTKKRILIISLTFEVGVLNAPTLNFI